MASLDRIINMDRLQVRLLLFESGFAAAIIGTLFFVRRSSFTVESASLPSVPTTCS